MSSDPKQLFQTETEMKRFQRSKHPWSIVCSWVTSGIAILSCIRWCINDPAQQDMAVGAISLIAVLALINTIIQLKEFRQDRGSQGAREYVLQGILNALHSTIQYGGGKQFESPGLRICLHVPKEDGNWYQLTDYAGPNQKRGRGKLADMSKGVVGEAFRTGRLVVAKLPGNSNLIDFSLAYGYDRSEAAELKPDRQSWLAIPIGEPDAPIAVLYCDSSESEFFGAANQFRQKVLKAAVLGIAEFVTSR